MTRSSTLYTGAKLIESCLTVFLKTHVNTDIFQTRSAILRIKNKYTSSHINIKRG